MLSALSALRKPRGFGAVCFFWYLFLQKQEKYIEPFALSREKNATRRGRKARVSFELVLWEHVCALIHVELAAFIQRCEKDIFLRYFHLGELFLDVYPVVTNAF